MDRAALHLIRASDQALSIADRREAFGRVVDEYQDLAFAVAFAILNDSHEAQDASLEAFVEAWRRLTTLRDPAAFPAWLRTLVRSRALCRTRRVRPRLVPLIEADGAGRPCQLPGSEEGIVLNDAIMRLPSAEREAVALFYAAGLTRQEAAEFTGTSLASTKKRLARALTRLRKEMIEMSNEDFTSSRPSINTDFRRRMLLIAGRFAELLASGQPILLALDDCIAEAGGGTVEEAFREIKGQVLRAQPMADAMLRYPALFQQSDAEAILVGEELGRVDVVLRRLANGERFESTVALRQELA